VMDSSETSFIPQLGDARPSFSTKKNVHLRRKRALVSISVAPRQRPPSCVRAGSPQSHRHPSSLVSYFFFFFFFLFYRRSLCFSCVERVTMDVRICIMIHSILSFQ
jgi:hypothetical protein